MRKIATLLAVSATLALLSNAAFTQEKKTGTIIGEVKSQKSMNEGKNTSIEVLAPGEEKARAYHVVYDMKLKGPNPTLLASVRAAKVGDRVELQWIETGHGPAIQTFKILKKAP